MRGTKIDKLYEYLSNGHEISFTYNGNEYSMESDGDALTIWKYGREPKCILSHPVPDSRNVQTSIQEFLNIKCFNGKSFMEIEHDVVVDTIY